MDDEARKRIESRVKGRSHAEIALSLIDDDDAKDTEFMSSFVARMMGEVQPVRVEAIQHEPIARLGAMEIPFGKYNGMTFDDAPLEYLDWLCRSQEDFLKVLRLYLRHPELEARRSREIGEPV